MNTPSAGEGNWGWRCPGDRLTIEIAKKLAAIVEVTDRDGVPPEPLPSDKDKKKKPDEAEEAR